MNPNYIVSLDKVAPLRDEERAALRQVTDTFAFRSNEYYLSLIDWEDRNDPIRRLIIPDTGELEEWGHLDPSSESTYTKAPGLQHKYLQTALMLVSDVCGGLCRYCFRKRLFIEESNEVVRDLSPALAYIRRHPEITNVLLTGGDPLMLSTEVLERIVRSLRTIDHVQIIRIGSKIPAFNPYRIISDPSLAAMIRKYSTPEKRIYIMAQFTHPRELTDVAVQALDILQDAGAVLMQQTPLIRGINDDPRTLADLFKKLSFVGATPYYVFQCRPTVGNSIYGVPVEESYQIFEDARAQCSGLAKSARFVMSHQTGKIEVVGKTGNCTYFKYNQAADPADIGRFMIYRSNPDAYWFDDYTEPVDDEQVAAGRDDYLPRELGSASQ